MDEGYEMERRRTNPPCDLHSERIENLSKELQGIKLTLFGPEGTGGIVKTINDSAMENRTFRKIFYVITVPMFGMIVGIAFKLFFMGGK